MGATAVIVAGPALLVAFLALVLRNGDDDGTAATGSGAAVPVSLSELAIDPAGVTVPAAGSLEVTNDGSAEHDLTIAGTDLTTGLLGPGESATLDVSSLEPDEYELLCSVPGHKDAGMEGTLTVTGDGGSSGAAAPADGADGTTTDGEHMTEEDYQRLDQAMHDSINAFPAETEGRGIQLLEATVLADGTKRYEPTAEITPWEVEPGVRVDAWVWHCHILNHVERETGMFGMATAVVVE